MYAFIISTMHDKYPAHLTTLRLCNEAYKIPGSTLLSVQQRPSTSSLLCPHIHLSILLSNF